MKFYVCKFSSVFFHPATGNSQWGTNFKNYVYFHPLTLWYIVCISIWFIFVELCDPTGYYWRYGRKAWGNRFLGIALSPLELGFHIWQVGVNPNSSSRDWHSKPATQNSFFKIRRPLNVPRSITTIPSYWSHHGRPPPIKSPSQGHHQEGLAAEGVWSRRSERQGLRFGEWYCFHFCFFLARHFHFTSCMVARVVHSYSFFPQYHTPFRRPSIMSQSA